MGIGGFAQGVESGKDLILIKIKTSRKKSGRLIIGEIVVVWCDLRGEINLSSLHEVRVSTDCLKTNLTPDPPTHLSSLGSWRGWSLSLLPPLSCCIFCCVVPPAVESLTYILLHNLHDYHSWLSGTEIKPASKSIKVSNVSLSVIKFYNNQICQNKQKEPFKNFDSIKTHGLGGGEGVVGIISHQAVIKGGTINRDQSHFL